MRLREFSVCLFMALSFPGVAFGQAYEDGLVVPDVLPQLEGVVPGGGAAPSPGGPVAEAPGAITLVQVNQPYSSSLGELTLPFMWDVVEQDGRVVATEGRSASPGVLTLDLLTTFAGADGDKVAGRVIESMAEALGAEVSKHEAVEICLDGDQRRCKNKAIRHRGVMSGQEAGVLRRCAYSVLPTGQKLLVVTFCAYARREYSPDILDIVDEVFDRMK